MKQKRRTLTPYGRMIRIFRLEADIWGKEMAADLNVTHGFLWFIENEKKSIPLDWFDRMQKVYKNNEYWKKYKERIFDSILKTKRLIKLPPQKTETKQKLCSLFAMRIDTMTDKIVKEITKILEKNRNEG